MAAYISLQTQSVRILAQVLRRIQVVEIVTYPLLMKFETVKQSQTQSNWTLNDSPEAVPSHGKLAPWKNKKRKLTRKRSAVGCHSAFITVWFLSQTFAREFVFTGDHVMIGPADDISCIRDLKRQFKIDFSMDRDYTLVKSIFNLRR